MNIQVLRGMQTRTLAYVYAPVSTQNLAFILSPVIFDLSTTTVMQCRHFATKSMSFERF